MPPTEVSPGTQISPHTPAPVRAIALLEARADVHDELAVRLRARRLRPAHPLVEPSSGDTERLAHPSRLPHATVLGDEGELQCGSFVKKAIAFFKMSRSALVLASSRLSLEISASSGRCLPRPGNARSPFLS